MPPTGQCAMFGGYQMSAWCKSSVRQIGLELRVQTHTELSVLLSAEVIKIGVEDHFDVHP